MASSEAEMRETVVTSATQIRTEERWEGRYGVQEQMTISGAAGAAASKSAGATFAAGAVATGATEVLPELFCFIFLPFTFWFFPPESYHKTQSVYVVHIDVRI